jgi:Zinc finger, C3HC4 type (RING finger)
MENLNTSFYFNYHDKVNFESKTEYLLRIKNETDKLRFLFNISESMAIQFLFENKLNLEEAMSSLFKFFGAEKNGVFSFKQYDIDEKANICEICLDFQEKRVSNNCGHYFCQNCYIDFIANNLQINGYEGILVKCPEVDCGVNFNSFLN